MNLDCMEKLQKLLFKELNIEIKKTEKCRKERIVNVGCVYYKANLKVS